MIYYLNIAVNAPLIDTLTYTLEASEPPKKGQVVIVPLGRRKAQGVITHYQTHRPDSEFELKPIYELLSTTIAQDYLDWLIWMADYYVYPLGLVLDLSLIKLKTVAAKPRRSALKPTAITTPLVLNNDQKQIVDKIPNSNGFEVHLIHGVTGAGKTEVYLELFQKICQNSGQGLFLLPEISLTPQMIQRFSARFGQDIAIIHSQLTPAQRQQEWLKATSGEAKIIIGARSALFCPLPNLKLIIIDEEHDTSFKQDTKLRYHARNAAIKLSQIKQIPIILGSATPSLETLQNVNLGKYFIHRLTQRAKTNFPADIQIIDMRAKKSAKSSLPNWLSSELYLSIQSVLEQGNQCALFLNRRGFSSIVFCDSCGYHYECPNCDIALTLHHGNMMLCHYCGYQESLHEHCPSCKEGTPKPYGIGTEQIEADLMQLFPDKKIARIDRDEITHIQQLEDTIKKIESGEFHILVGTQMIAKGLDFPNLKLVGFVLADIGLQTPDFRAQEKALQLLRQMTGRAGRHATSAEQAGKVLIQTYQPDNSLFQFIQDSQSLIFESQELINRQELMYPPYGKIAVFQFQGRDLSLVQQGCHFLVKSLNHVIETKDYRSDVHILGPVEAPIARLRNKYRYQVILKVATHVPLSAICKWALVSISKQKINIEVHVDVDPQHLL